MMTPITITPSTFQPMIVFVVVSTIIVLVLVAFDLWYINHLPEEKI